MSVIVVQANECTCERCGRVWRSRGNPPLHCPECNSPYWNTPRRKKGVSDAG